MLVPRSARRAAAQMPFNFPDEADALNFKVPAVTSASACTLSCMRHSVSARTWYHTGANGYNSPNLTIEYDFVGSAANNVAFLGGLGGG